MNEKTMAKHLELLASKKIEKSEINAISKFLNSMRFNDPTRTDKNFAELLLSLVNSKERSISKEQTEFGKKWLLDRYFTKKGATRKQLEHDFPWNEREEVIDIIKNFKKFTFVGYRSMWDSYSKVNTGFLPIYRVIGKDGKSFTYSPEFHGTTDFNPEPTELVFE